jgi:hypothetical protein
MTYKLLTDTERSTLLAYITECATDEMLIAAVESVQAAREFVSSSMKSIRAKLPTKAVSKPLPAYSEEAVPKPIEPENATPPGTASSRVGGTTEQSITRLLGSKAASESEINDFLKGKLSNTRSVLKLLWQRKKLKFNGKEFYL